MSPKSGQSTARTEGRRARLGTKPALLLVNIGQLLTLASPGAIAGPRRGKALGELSILNDASVLCVAGKIVAVGRTRDALRDSWVKQNGKGVEEIDCGGKVVLPGFVDSHTHPVFASPRLVDFEKRVSGATYEEIASAGGGIRASIDGVRNTAKPRLVENCLAAFNDMLGQGTTTIEAKSGYGLSVEAELKSLEVIRDAAKRWPGTVVSTLLGAHVVPPEYRQHRAEYVRQVCEEMIPRAAKARLAQFADVFVETGAFESGEAERIFDAAARHGLGIRAHVCQLTPAQLEWIWRFDPASLDHMDHANDCDMKSLAVRNTVASLLPGADYFLGVPHYPEARKLIDSGAAVALATDYNPGTSPTPSMPFVMSLACTHMKMSPAEALGASTINAAHALRMADRKGSIEPGKDADLAIFDVRDYREIPYWFAANKCAGVVVGGRYLHTKAWPV